VIVIPGNTTASSNGTILSLFMILLGAPGKVR
jgi:hypothetical protein